jgi:hypothetical protein
MLIALVTAICGCILIVGVITPRPALSEEPLGYADLSGVSAQQGSPAVSKTSIPRPMRLRLRAI